LVKILAINYPSIQSLPIAKKKAFPWKEIKLGFSPLAEPGSKTLHMSSGGKVNCTINDFGAWTVLGG
jgi:hypothetical protein